MGDREKALQELESLRGRVSGDHLDKIIKEVNGDFDRGGSSPAVLVNINDCLDSEITEHIITVINCYQGSANVTEFVKYIKDSKEDIQRIYLTSRMVRFMAAADRKFRDGN